MRYNVLIGGKAGLGPNILTQILGEALVELGYYVFYSRDYQSLIRGGHNFNVLTFGDKPAHSNDSEIDVLVCLDENTEELHKKELKKNGVVLKGEHENMFFAGKLFKLFCIDFKVLESRLKKLEKRYEENIKEAREGYDEEKREVCKIISKKNKNYFVNGNQGISNGAIKSGVDVYFAYPMTPATPILNEIASVAGVDDKNIFVFELENEISVINSALGASITGAKAMVGTSGGGFDLMTEAFSMAAMAEIPLVVYLSSRPGPGTGVATYTGQGDLQLARHCGHGEFKRVVLAPGDPKEAEELTSQCFYYSQKYKLPAIILGDKHLAESFYTLEEAGKITKSEKFTKLGRYNSYEIEHEFNTATEEPEIIEKNVIERMKKGWALDKEAEKFERYKIYGKEKSKNAIISWGSTKGAIIDAIKDMDVCFVQLLYIEPFPKEIKKYLNGKNIILVENNTGTLSEVIAEKCLIQIEDKNKILKFNGRPFNCDGLKKEIEKRIKK